MADMQIDKYGNDVGFDKRLEDIKNHIFDKYVTGAKKYHKIGFGLGLYISKKIVDEHKGKIYLTTNGNKNKFVVEIPCVSE